MMKAKPNKTRVENALEWTAINYGFFKVHNNCAIINHCHHHRGFHDDDDDDDDVQEGGLMGLHYTSVNATLGNITTTTTTSKTVLEDIEGVRNLKYLCCGSEHNY